MYIFVYIYICIDMVPPFKTSMRRRRGGTVKTVRVRGLIDTSTLEQKDRQAVLSLLVSSRHAWLNHTVHSIWRLV